MKVAELLVSPLVEGTWELPDTVDKVREVMRLLKEPLMWSDRHRVERLYNLTGDDDLFDDLDRAKDDPSQDLRDILLRHLPRLLDTSTWSTRPDDATQFAVNQLRKLVTHLRDQRG